MKFGIIGLGWPGQQHVKAIEAHANIATLSAVCDLDAVKLEPYQNVTACFQSVEQFYAEGDFDAVVLAVPHHLHADMAIEAMEKGKHVLIEKPMARTVEECMRMNEVAERTGRTLMVAHNWRYTPWCIAAKEIVETGELGTVQAVRSEWLLNFRPSFPKGNWIYNGELAGGGAIISLAIHNVDALRFIIGEIDQVFTQSMHTDDWSTNGAENWAMSQFRFTNGAIGHLFTGYTPFHPPEHGMMYIYGDQGTLFFGPYKGETGLWIRSAERSVDPEASYEKVDVLSYTPDYVPHAQTNQLKHFIDCVQSGSTPITGGKEIIHTIALLEKMYESERKKQPVNVSEEEAH